MCPDIPIDARIAPLAGQQHGNVTREQLLGLGMWPTSIRRRLQTGRLHRARPGVYAVGRPPRTALEHASAALLACGPHAALSHGSAMALWGFWKVWPMPHQVTLLDGDRRPNGIQIHRTQGLDRSDLRRRDGLRVTSPAQTLLDVAPAITDRSLGRAVNDARLSNHLKLGALAEALVRHPRHRGVPRLRPFVERGGAPTRSDFEDLFPGFCERFDLPRPTINARIAGYEVDVVFPAQKVIVELDGYEFHSDRAAFERDRDRDADLLLAGFVVVRITWTRLITSPEREAERLRQILSARS